MTNFRTIGRAAVLLSALLAGGSGYAAESPSPAPTAPPAETPAAAPAAQPHTWPRVLQEGAETLTIYQPQIEKWDDTSITFRAAIAVEPAQGAEPIYGMVRTTARADVDKAARTVTLHDFQIVKVTFPTAPERDVSYLPILSQHLPAGVKELSLDRLEASVAVSQAVKKQRGLGVNNDPPRILFSTSPALLVLVDGEPVLRALDAAAGVDLSAVASAKAERVINTRALIVKAGGVFYLTALNCWYQATEIGGPWSPLTQPPAFLAQARQAAAAGGQVDLMEPETDAAPLEAPPLVHVSTIPAELIQTDGEPRFIPIADTVLLQAQNSDDAIFMDSQIGDYFVLISGRWFKSASLYSDQWQFVPAKDLPGDFAKIPADNPRANALVSVPGTPEAQEALIADSIPQTATVARGPATVDLLYDGAADGAPQFEPVAGVPDLQYAANASLPVIEAAPDSFYCVQNGIWFVAPTAAGPWVVATAVPPAICTIPPSCPLHYVTYCHIYGFTQQEVYCGYTPGYLGAIVSDDGVVVYGTGYFYQPHIGRAWIPQPCTYGFNAGFECGPDTGFAFGFAEGIFAGGRPAPYWGPYDWGSRHRFNYSHINLNHVNVYEHWQGNVVSIPQRGERGGARENAQPHPQPPFNPYSARPTVLARSPSVAPEPHAPPAAHEPTAHEPAAHAPAAHEPAERPAQRDWSANAKPRPQSFGQPPATTAATQPTPASKPNNVFVSVTGDVYRRTPATTIVKSQPTTISLPATNAEPVERPRAAEPAARPEPVQAPRETPTPSPQPAPPIQWEQHTQAGWKPAAQSPAFQKAAPELNREAAARDTGESRAVGQPSTFQARPSSPIVPSSSSAPTPAGGRRR